MKMKSQLYDFISRLYKSLHVFIFILKSKTTPCLVCKQLTVVGLRGRCGQAATLLVETASRRASDAAPTRRHFMAGRHV